MDLSAKEEVLVQAFRRLPPAAAEELSALVERLASIASDSVVDWSDSWSKEDLEDFTSASIHQIDADA